MMEAWNPPYIYEGLYIDEALAARAAVVKERAARIAAIREKRLEEERQRAHMAKVVNCSIHGRICNSDPIFDEMGIFQHGTICIARQTEIVAGVERGDTNESQA